MRRLVATLLLLGLSAPAAARLRVCTLALNGPDEVETFRSYLGTDEFDFVDLTSTLAPDPSDDRTAPAIRCPAELRCDVVVISAEFGGRFFGSSGRSVSLQDLEEASCQPACAGVFHAPQEIFLLACNTLATKDQDTRTPAEYLSVLRAHGFDEADAERVVAIRYGPLGQSFRETIRRVFAGVPRLYGFSTVAARGETTAVQLARYFTARADYARHLLTTWDDPSPNRALEAAFAHTGMTQVSGLAPDDPGAGDHDVICRLYDDDGPLVDRLRVVRDLMSRDDALSFVPTVEAFLSAHDPATFGRKERAVFAEIQAADDARAEVLRLVEQLDVSALQIELAHLAERLGWMSREKLRVLAANGVRELLARRLTSELVDVTCAITQHEPVGKLFRSADLPGLLFERAEGLRLVACLAPPDAAVNARLLAALDDQDESVRSWAAYALTRRLPLDDATLRKLGARANDESVDVSTRVRWILAQVRPSRHARR
jgi:hypothetical protein